MNNSGTPKNYEYGPDVPVEQASSAFLETPSYQWIVDLGNAPTEYKMALI